MPASKDPASSSKPSPSAWKIPWFNTRLTTDIRWYFSAQPLFWLLGIEFFAPVALMGWFLFKRLLMNARLRIPVATWSAIMLFLWQLAHISTVQSGEMDLFVKAQGTLLALICLFVVIYNAADTSQKWTDILVSIERLGNIALFFGALFILGLWSGKFRSLLGIVLPRALVSGSFFFSSLAERQLGVSEPATGFRRVQSTFWHPNGYAAVLLLLFGIQWYLLRRDGWRKQPWRVLALILTLAQLFFTYSRTSYVALIMMAFVLWWLEKGNYRNRLLRLLFVAGMLTGFVLYVFIALLAEGTITFSLLNQFVYGIRPYSISTRLLIYQETWRLLLQKPLWGWSTLVRIEGLPSYFSAGSHSDFLSILFQYGIPALLFYLVFLVSIWRVQVKGYRLAQDPEAKRFFAVAMAIMLAIVLRQFTSGLFWDVYVASVIWGIWALSLARYTLLQRQTQTVSS